MAKKRGVRDIKSLARKKHEDLEMTLLLLENETEEEIDLLIEGDTANIEEIEIYSKRATVGYKPTVENVSGIHPSILLKLRVKLYTEDIECPVAEKCEDSGFNFYCWSKEYKNCPKYKRLTRK